MLRAIKYFPALCTQFVEHCVPSLTFHLNRSRISHHKVCALSGVRYVSVSEPRMYLRRLDRKGLKNTKKELSEEGTLETVEISKKKIEFPTVDLPNTLFNNVPFKDLPVVNVQISPNNTIMSLTDKGVPKVVWSCGAEGFKNAKKGTGVAAQSTAITFSSMALDKGYKTVRVRVKGFGPGRMSSVQGMVMGGLDIVSVTDNTPVSENPPRPKKLRRI